MYENDSPNLHYQARADARSVMYGNFITDTGDPNDTTTVRTFQRSGGVRGYSPLDQYMMGLIGPDELPDPVIFFVDEEGAEGGDPTMPMWRTDSDTITGRRVNVSVDDLVRAMGPRIPAAGDEISAFDVAFILVETTDRPATAADIAKVEAYRTRFASWFGEATDGRGTMRTDLVQGCGGVDPGDDPPGDDPPGDDPPGDDPPGDDPPGDDPPGDDPPGDDPPDDEENGYDPSWPPGQPPGNGGADGGGEDDPGLGTIDDTCGCASAGAGGAAAWLLLAGLGWALLRRRGSARG